MQEKFWQTKKLDELTPAEWEALCDGCGRCCLEKLEDDDTGEVLYTNVACWILDIRTCRCRHYAKRHQYVPECLPITLQNNKMFSWLPSTCAYRLMLEEKKLPRWHYLVCGDRNELHREGISVRKLALAQQKGMDLEDYIIGTL